VKHHGLGLNVDFYYFRFIFAYQPLPQLQQLAFIIVN
jgi:hypothetical protein